MMEQTHRRGPGTWALIALGGAVLLMLLGWIVAALVGPGGHVGPGYGWGMMTGSAGLVRASIHMPKS